VDDKSNEITAIPELLKLLDIASCIVTIDAIGTQTEIVQTIVDSGADYLLSVKENQGNLFDDIQYLFEVDATQGFAQVPHSYTQKVNKGHGRLKTRECWVIDDEEYLAYLRKRERWPGLT
jgi:predicted transposase YbfD/YdcC